MLAVYTSSKLYKHKMSLLKASYNSNDYTSELTHTNNVNQTHKLYSITKLHYISFGELDFVNLGFMEIAWHEKWLIKSEGFI